MSNKLEVYYKLDGMLCFARLSRVPNKGEKFCIIDEATGKEVQYVVLNVATKVAPSKIAFDCVEAYHIQIGQA